MKYISLLQNCIYFRNFRTWRYENEGNMPLIALIMHCLPQDGPVRLMLPERWSRHIFSIPLIVYMTKDLLEDSERWREEDRPARNSRK